MSDTRKLAQALASANAFLVKVESTEGSVPREPGAWMGVFADSVVGTIGGGHLEWQAIAEARRRLAGASGPDRLRYALGPALGQCCGGVVYLHYAPLSQADLAPAGALWAQLEPARHPLALFGGGHVGQALARVLAPLPFALTWIDSRESIFPEPAPPGVVCEHSDPVHQAVAPLAAGSRVLVMSFSHAEDLDIVAACLARQRQRGDLPFVGLIGSQTKWAAFRSRLAQRGFGADEIAHITCPIGVPGIDGKQPEVIAVAVAAQLLQTLPSTAATQRARAREASARG